MLALSNVVIMVLVVTVATSINPKHPHGPIQAFKTISTLKHVFAISTSSDNPKFQCLVSDAVLYDPEHMVASYIWSLRSPDGTENPKKSTFHISPGSSVDQLTFFMDNDFSTPYTAYYNFSNYKDCLVAIIPYEGENLCMLWVDRSVADAIPNDCEEQYEDTCDVRFPAYFKDICNVAGE